MTHRIRTNLVRALKSREVNEAGHRGSQLTGKTQTGHAKSFSLPPPNQNTPNQASTLWGGEEESSHWMVAANPSGKRLVATVRATGAYCPKNHRQPTDWTDCPSLREPGEPILLTCLSAPGPPHQVLTPIIYPPTAPHPRPPWFPSSVQIPNTKWQI